MNKVISVILICLVVIIIIYTFRTKISLEGFQNAGETLFNYNLLKNGSFENGKNVEEYYESKNSQIIKYENNPGCNDSTYVLKQTNNPSYILKVNIQPKSNYHLSFWVLFDDATNTRDLVSIKPLSQSSIKERIIDKKTIKGKTWYKYEYSFNTSYDSNYLLNINGKTTGTRYVTDIKLVPYLSLDENFLATIGLKTYLDATNKNSCNPSLSWNDLSNMDAKYVWSTKPVWNTDGFYKTNNNTLTGPSINKLGVNYSNETEFTIIILSKNLQSFGESNETNNYSNVLQINGNQDIALQLELPMQNGPIKLRLGDSEYKINQINTNTKYMYTLTHKDNIPEIWLNDTKLKFDYKNIPKLHFEDNKIILNKDKTWNANIYAFMVYNKKLTENEIKYINYYLTYYPKKTIPIIPFPQPFIPTHKPSTPLNPPSMPLKPINPPIISLCPSAQYRDGRYYINIPKGSKYADKLGYGIRDYGKNKERAYEIYKLNFPDCLIPDILQFGPTDNCPFIIAKNNPCNYKECRNVDWTQTDPSKMRLNKHCLKHISHYCHINKGIDPMCSCWEEQNKYSPKCQEFRKHFEPPEDYGFSINIFDISEHPDYKNYIRKDRIPCWGCNLNAPQPKDRLIKGRNWRQSLI